MPIEASSKPDKVYLGTGWQNKGGIAISIKKEIFDKLPVVNEYGEVKLFVGLRREVDPKSKATHWVAVAQESSWSPPKPPTGMPEDPVGHTPDKDLPWAP